MATGNVDADLLREMTGFASGRLNGQIKRRPHVVGIFPSELAIRRSTDTILMQQIGEWTMQRSRHLTLEILAPPC